VYVRWVTEAREDTVDPGLSVPCPRTVSVDVLEGDTEALLEGSEEAVRLEDTVAVGERVPAPPRAGWEGENGGEVLGVELSVETPKN